MHKRYYTREAKKLLDLVWEDAIYKDQDLDHQDVAMLLGFNYYKPSVIMCRRNFDLTVEKFFKACKVNEVKQFLDQPESRQMSLLDIAHEMGYPHRRNFNRQFKAVENITPREFWYFLDDFKETTGKRLVYYQKPETEKYIPEDNEPNFLSNFLNRQVEKVLLNENHNQ